MTRLNNEVRELTIGELDNVSGGDLPGWIAGAIVGEVVHFLLNHTDSTPTNVLNGVLGAIGQKPV
jgi:hypothetical protein